MGGGRKQGNREELASAGVGMGGRKNTRGIGSEGDAPKRKGGPAASRRLRSVQWSCI